MKITRFHSNDTTSVIHSIHDYQLTSPMHPTPCRHLQPAPWPSGCRWSTNPCQVHPGSLETVDISDSKAGQWRMNAEASFDVLKMSCVCKRHEGEDVPDQANIRRICMVPSMSSMQHIPRSASREQATHQDLERVIGSVRSAPRT